MAAAYRGGYNDGKTAAKRDVSVTLDLNGLKITDADGRVVDHWPYETLRRLDEAFPDRPLRLACATGDGARLALPDHHILDDLLRRAPQLQAHRRGRGAAVARWAVLTVMAVLVLAAVLWIALPRGAALATRLVPVSWEVALGDKMMEQVVEIFATMEDQEPRFCAAQPGRAALDGLVARLAAASAAPYDLRVAVLDLEIANAFALPGGQMVIFRGLIEMAQSPEEVAGVLAHEIGHVTRRHSTQMILRSLGVTFFFGIMLGDLGSGAIAAAGETLVTLSYSREAEAEADASAVALLGAADIAAGGLATFFARLQEAEAKLPKALVLLSSHPRSENRARAVAAAAGQGGPALSPENWTALQGICGG